jgi:uncharacterized protein (DUF427 family)
MSSPHSLRIEPSRSAVRVAYKGVVIAETQRPVLLHEGGLPTRYYIPAEDVRIELLTPSKHETTCPFKGTATYWSLRMGEETVPDFVWSYPDPIPEAEGIKGLLCFYNENVDLDVDGETQPKPKTPWSAAEVTAD